MKKRFLSLLLILMLLCGCTPEASVPAEGGGNRFSSVSEPISYTPLSQQNCLGFVPVGNDLLILNQNSQDQAVLTLISGQDLAPLESVTLETVRYPSLSRFQFYPDKIICLDSGQNQFLVLDAGLQVLRQIPLPPDWLDNALLSRDLGTIYYGTAQGICAADVEDGSRRELLHDVAPEKELNALLDEDRILSCTLTMDSKRETVYVSTDTGEILEASPDRHQLLLQGQDFYAVLQDNLGQLLFFGPRDRRPQALLLNTDAQGTFLPRSRRAVCWTPGTVPGYITLQCYDLDNGLRTSALDLDQPFTPWSAAETEDSRIWLLGQSSGASVLVCWQPELSPCVDSSFCLIPYYTARHPDLSGLKRCQDHAAELSRKYGIEILVWRDVQKVTPWDYDLLTEHRVPVLEHELALLDEYLASYPDDMLRIISRNVNGLHLCLVRAIYGKGGMGGLPAVSGLQYEEDGSYYISFVTGRATEHTLYHELCHILDFYVLPRSSAYDGWLDLNPPGFDYDYDYLQNQSRSSPEYLQPHTRAFIDTYSMSYPEEDRARIMEYAMTPGHGFLFDSPIMQSKLAALSQGIREAFSLTEDPRVFLWEQYLRTPEPMG